MASISTAATEEFSAIKADVIKPASGERVRAGLKLGAHAVGATVRFGGRLIRRSAEFAWRHRSGISAGAAAAGGLVMAAATVKAGLDLHYTSTLESYFDNVMEISKAARQTATGEVGRDAAVAGAGASVMLLSWFANLVMGYGKPPKPVQELDPWPELDKWLLHREIEQTWGFNTPGGSHVYIADSYYQYTHSERHEPTAWYMGDGVYCAAGRGDEPAMGFGDQIIHGFERLLGEHAAQSALAPAA